MIQNTSRFGNECYSHRVLVCVTTTKDEYPNLSETPETLTPQVVSPDSAINTGLAVSSDLNSRVMLDLAQVLSAHGGSAHVGESRRIWLSLRDQSPTNVD